MIWGVYMIRICQNTEITHIDELYTLSKNADTLVLVSPFLSSDIGNLLSKMKKIKRVDLYTNLDGYEQGVANVESLCAFSDYCEGKGIILNMFYDDSLHGKVYLFYKGSTPMGFITTSANFTDRGLSKNREFGLSLLNADLQEEMMNIIKESEWTTLSLAHLKYLYSEAKNYKMKHPVKKVKPFKASSFVKSEISSTTRYFVKNIGRKESRHPQKPMMDDFQLGFSDKGCKKGDILVINAIGYSIIMGMYMILDDNPDYFLDGPTDKWPYKYKVRCMTREFSKNWWRYNLSTMPLEEDFVKNRLSPEYHIRGDQDSLQNIKWGKPFIINKEFADFVLKRMNEAVSKGLKW